MNNKHEHNQQAWDKIAEAEDRWFRAVTSEEIEEARSGDLKLRLTPTKFIPQDWLQGLSAKRVLCLAGAGGRQAPLLAAAGATVTVFDISQRQLQRDQFVAERDELEIVCVQGDMSDLSDFDDESFDLIINPTSLCYSSNPLKVWSESFRVLANSGELITGLMNPINFLFDFRKRDRGELVVRHAIPYSDLQLSTEERSNLKGSDHPIEFGHSLDQLLGGQIAAGFEITGFFEDRWGDDDILSDLLAVFFCSRACKRNQT